MNDPKIEACARAAHEVNRAYCLALNDPAYPPQLPYDEAPEEQRESLRKGVAGCLKGNTPEQSHEGWLSDKEAAGWKYGPVKDAEKKEHPCFVPYSDLPKEQQKKDSLFIGAVRLVGASLGLTITYPADNLGEARTIDWSKQ